MTFRNPLHGTATFALSLIALFLFAVAVARPDVALAVARFSVALTPYLLLACVVGGAVGAAVWAIERPDAARALAAECLDNAADSTHAACELLAACGRWIADNTRSRMPAPCLAASGPAPIPVVTYSATFAEVEAIDLDSLWADRSIDDTSAIDDSEILAASRAALASLDASIADLEAMMRADDDGMGMAITGTIAECEDRTHAGAVRALTTPVVVDEMVAVAANGPVKAKRSRKVKTTPAADRPLFVRDGKHYRPALEGEQGTHWYTGSAFYPVSLPASYVSK